MIRLVWQEKPGNPEARSQLLDALDERVAFTIRPRPVAESAPPLPGEEEPRRLEGLDDLHHAIPATVDDGDRGLEILRDFPLVESAVLELDVRPPPLLTDAASAPCKGVEFKVGEPIQPTQDWSHCQSYLGSASGHGVDAYTAWRYKGGQGDQVVLLDIEKGYNQEHEDLRHVKTEPNTPLHEHGTMSLGVCCGHGKCSLGIRGIAYESVARFFPVEIHFKPGYEYPLTAAAMTGVLPDLPPGSVVLLELQTSHRIPGKYNGRYFPVEVSPDVRRAIEYAARQDIYVVEAAGNGDVDLDQAGVTCPTPAIVVGAGTVPKWNVFGQAGLRFRGSNYGSRVDVQGWGERVVTTGERVVSGPGWQDNLQRDLRTGGERRCYTSSFNGTSSASAMVAGVVACLVSIVKAHGLALPTPRYLKELLRTTGTQQPVGAKRRIGPLPDLKSAIAKMETDYGVKFDPA